MSHPERCEGQRLGQALKERCSWLTEQWSTLTCSSRNSLAPPLCSRCCVASLLQQLGLAVLPVIPLNTNPGVAVKTSLLVCSCFFLLKV